MFFRVSPARVVDDTDLSDLTGSERVGETVSVEGGVDIPFDHDPSPAEVEAISIRLASASTDEERARWAVRDALATNVRFLAQSSPRSLEQLEAQVVALTEQHDAWFRLMADRFDLG